MWNWNRKRERCPCLTLNSLRSAWGPAHVKEKGLKEIGVRRGLPGPLRSGRSCGWRLLDALFSSRRGLQVDRNYQFQARGIDAPRHSLHLIAQACPSMLKRIRIASKSP